MILSDLLLLFSTKCEVGLPSNSDKIFLLTIFQFLISQKVGFNFAKFPSMSGLNPAEIKYLFLGLTTQPLREILSSKYLKGKQATNILLELSKMHT